MAEEIKYLGNAAVAQLVTEIKSADAAVLQAAKDHANGLADNYDAAGTAATKVQELADGQVKTNKEAIDAINNTETGILKQAKDYADTQDNGVKSTIGTMDNLETTAKGDLVSAINEVRNAVSAGGTAAAITMTEKTSDLGEGVAKAYVLMQGDNTVGTINIPKDMVVQSGEVVVNPDGQDAGTYIKLTLANATNDVIYVNVGTLVDIYKAKASAAQVQIAIDSATREISASIVAGSVTSTEMADNAVVTAKIADGNVTKAKLSAEVQTELGKAHEHANKDVLDSYDKTQDAIIDLINDNEQSIDTLTEGKADKATTLAGYGITDAYTCVQVDATTNALQDDLDAVVDRVEALEAVAHTEITAAEITAMFAS